MGRRRRSKKSILPEKTRSCILAFIASYLCPIFFSHSNPGKTN
ncbi:unknown protein [Desulfotalea psychrophila LSv54]|uniref:Uncharacterized protein n=1 Tax=Desulfotalea psychrophila (strain LSv54 / DSM 12343) TaxID=177439 RepID=Q6ARQ1_DESPS|nr:unknown protein [Desulfotalea psychrophila LSv54]